MKALKALRNSCFEIVRVGHRKYDAGDIIYNCTLCERRRIENAVKNGTENDRRGIITCIRRVSKLFQCVLDLGISDADL